ncbi:helix-turn-helix domain-containing protein [Priestia megaterium]|uniref:helix-turn-helix domain-containing protein n=1 Tax=Priestia megaterium TaxID=1404 RepID=UPI0012B7CCFB|nr:helix-turn-helix domain-containing protein [Priestia megaterium]
MSDQLEKIERVKKLKSAITEANKKAKLNDFKNESEMKSLQQEVLELMEQITGDKHAIIKQKDIFAGEPFNQVIHRNLDLLNQIGYLTTAEESFLFKIQAYLEFKSNVIVCREEKFKRKRTKKQSLEAQDDEVSVELPKAANVTDIANMLHMSRRGVSKVMNSLKDKEILLNPEGAGQVIENGRTVSPRTWIVNPYILISAPRKNEVKLDILTMRLFQSSLRNLVDQDGKKVNLPVRFF